MELYDSVSGNGGIIPQFNPNTETMKHRNDFAIGDYVRVDDGEERYVVGVDNGYFAVGEPSTYLSPFSERPAKWYKYDRISKLPT